MNNLTKLSIGEMFGIDHISDLDKVERITLSPLEGDGQTLYLFRCEGLLPEGQKLAIDDLRGEIGVYHDGALLRSVSVNTVEIIVLTSLALSFWCSVEEYQLKNLSQLQKMNEKSLETTWPTIQELVAACNGKIRFLDIAILSVDGAYRLTAVSGERH